MEGSSSSNNLLSNLRNILNSDRLADRFNDSESAFFLGPMAYRVTFTTTTLAPATAEIPSNCSKGIRDSAVKKDDEDDLEDIELLLAAPLIKAVVMVPYIGSRSLINEDFGIMMIAIEWYLSFPFCQWFKVFSPKVDVRTPISNAYPVVGGGCRLSSM